MASIPESSPAPHIPAWKRLGLQLKNKTTPTEQSIQDTTAIPKRTSANIVEAETPPAKKVKRTKTQITTTSSALPALPSTPHLSRKKSVTFTPETKVEDGDSIKQLFNTWVADQKTVNPSFELKTSQAFQVPEPTTVVEDISTALPEKERRVKRVKKSDEPKVKKVKAKKASATDSPSSTASSNTPKPFLAYLKLYYEDKENWKFNKAHQNHLLKHIFDVGVVPSNCIHQAYAYVSGLQGGVRTRLRDEALAVKVKDLENIAMNPTEKREIEHELAVKEYCAALTEVNASTKMGVEEGIIANLSDISMASRLAKRARSEQILAALGNAPEGEYPVAMRTAENAAVLNAKGIGKATRKRKQRTRADTSSDESSDSDSSSDSDTETESGIKKTKAGSKSSANSKGGGTASTPLSIASSTSRDEEPDTSSDGSSSSSGKIKSRGRGTASTPFSISSNSTGGASDDGATTSSSGSDSDSESEDSD